MSEFTNEWLNEGRKEWMSEWMNEGRKEWMSEWMNDGRKEGMDEWMNEWVNEWKKEWMDGWMDGWMDESRWSGDDDEWLVMMKKMQDKQTDKYLGMQSEGWNEKNRFSFRVKMSESLI